MFTVKIRVLGIPVEARGSVDAADPSVGLSEGLCDVELFNVKNGSRLSWLETKLDKADAWDKVFDAIWTELDKCRGGYDDE